MSVSLSSCIIDLDLRMVIYDIIDENCTIQISFLLFLIISLHGVGQYMQAFRNQPDHPLHCFVVGLTFFHMACQRFVMKRHPLIVQVQYIVCFC